MVHEDSVDCRVGASKPAGAPSLLLMVVHCNLTVVLHFVSGVLSGCEEVPAVFDSGINLSNIYVISSHVHVRTT